MRTSAASIFSFHEQVLVYCWGGGSRTAQVLSAWLVREQGYDYSNAVESVCKVEGANRNVGLEQLSSLIG